MGDTLNGLALFAGVGMLDEGLRAGFEHLGVPTRIVGYVEREAYAAGVLAARMEEGSMARAPVWSDVTTFDGRPWRGVVDFITGGFPCQDISVAGRRAGLDGSRSGLFYEILRIADDSGARLLFLENVAGIASATATVMDEAEGDLLERAAARVVGELADRGWDAEWITLSASDVGASHGRERWFCLAWRELDDAERNGCAGKPVHKGSRREGIGAGNDFRPSDELGHTTRINGGQRDGLGIGEATTAGHKSRVKGSSGAVADADSDGFGGGRRTVLCESGKERQQFAQLDSDVADPECTRLQRPGSKNPSGGDEPESPSQDRGIFAPGPSDPRWPALLAADPGLAPALEPGFRGVVDGMAVELDRDRAARLRCGGNGVVALQAALALVVLARRAKGNGDK